MTQLLILSLTETTREKDGYEIIGIDISNNGWVIIPKLPAFLLKIEGEIAWDIFGITEVEIKLDPYAKRNQVYTVETSNYYPKMIKKPISSNRERNEILHQFSNSYVNELDNNPNWVGLLKDCSITDIIFREKKDTHGLHPNRTFYWECRLEFKDGNGESWIYNTASGVVCKDLRFKSYWKDLFNENRELFEEKKEKWLKYMEDNYTYLLVEFIPNDFYGTIAMISGVFCINREEV